MRGLSSDFLTSLKSGLLQPILDRIKRDDTLMLAIRNGYINIYYRGGNLLRITETQGHYELFFDNKYDQSQNHALYNGLNLPNKIIDQTQVNYWVSSIANLKEIMDFYFTNNLKLEREFQQLVARENNKSSISSETEYFITDIEYADSSNNSRFDITAIKWPASGRKDGKNCKASFIEMKYGDNQLGGSSGLIKHIQDINNFLSDKQNYSSILNEMATQFNQLDELGLLNFKHCTNNTKVQLSEMDKPEFIFLLANLNPRGSKLRNILLDPQFVKNTISQSFDLRFFVSSNAGYGMHSYNMISYDKYISRLP
jgi:hypothetical protein